MSNLTVSVLCPLVGPPYAEIKDDEPRGFTIDLLRAVLPQAEVEYVPDVITGLLYLMAGRGLLLADCPGTQRNGQYAALSHGYTIETLDAFLPHSGGLWPGIDRFLRPLAVVANSYAEEYMRRHHPRHPLVVVHDLVGAFQAVRDRRARAVVALRLLGLALIRREAHDFRAAADQFGAVPHAFAATADNRELIGQVDRRLQALERDGTLQRLREEWFEPLERLPVV